MSPHTAVVSLLPWKQHDNTHITITCATMNTTDHCITRAGVIQFNQYVCTFSVHIVYCIQSTPLSVDIVISITKGFWYYYVILDYMHVFEIRFI